MTSSLEQQIYFIRGYKVMLDHDLATLYAVPTKRLNEQVRRNEQRFPEDFMFQLTNQEVTNLRSQFATSSLSYGGRRYLPLVFTEHGVAMLSSVLNSERAIQANITIMRAFSRLRALLGAHDALVKRLDALEQQYDAQFKIVFDAIRALMTPTLPPLKRRIGFAMEGKK